jgi:hypothetical protein
MFNLDIFTFFKKLKPSNIESFVDEQQEIDGDNLFVELHPSHLSYKLNDGEINVVDFPIKEYKNIDDFLKLCLEALNVVVETLEVNPHLTLVIGSSYFMIKNSERLLEIDESKKYFVNKLALEGDAIEVKHLIDTSYLVVEFKFIQKILFAFKDFTIKNLYDSTLLNTLYLKPQNKHIYLDLSFGNFDILLHNEKLQKRNFDMNLFSLIDDCAKALYTDHDTAYQNIKMSFKDITTYEELRDFKKPLQKEILSFIDKTIEHIQSSIAFFSINENIDSISNVYVNGDILKLDFILKILSNRFEVTFTPVTHELKLNTVAKTNLSILDLLHMDSLKKLQINFDGLHYTDGRDEYIFIENKFVSKGKLTATQRSKIDTEQNRVKYNKKDNELSFDEDRKPLWKMSMTELGKFIVSKISSNDRFSQLGNNKRGIFYLFGVLLILMTIVGLFNVVTDSQRKFDNQVNTLEDRIKRVDVLKRNITAQNRALDLNVEDKKVDKIFWTQKFITLANMMQNEIWLSSISMTNVNKEIEGKGVVTQAMVLEARALPSSIGHIANIAKYMNNLLTADATFRKDFSNIYFGGAEIINEYGYDVINFKLLCHFEKNIKIKDIEVEELKTKDKSISENLQSINKNTKMKQEVLENIGKGN